MNIDERTRKARDEVFRRRFAHIKDAGLAQSDSDEWFWAMIACDVPHNHVLYVMTAMGKPIPLEGSKYITECSAGMSPPLPKRSKVQRTSEASE